MMVVMVVATDIIRTGTMRRVDDADEEEGEADEGEIAAGEIITAAAEDEEDGEGEVREMMVRCLFVIFATSTCVMIRRRRKRSVGTRSTKRRIKRRFSSATSGTIDTTRMNARGTTHACLWKL